MKIRVTPMALNDLKDIKSYIENTFHSRKIPQEILFPEGFYIRTLLHLVLLFHHQSAYYSYKPYGIDNIK